MRAKHGLDLALSAPNATDCLLRLCLSFGWVQSLFVTGGRESNQRIMESDAYEARREMLGERIWIAPSLIHDFYPSKMILDEERECYWFLTTTCRHLKMISLDGSKVEKVFKFRTFPLDMCVPKPTRLNILLDDGTLWKRYFSDGSVDRRRNYFVNGINNTHCVTRHGRVVRWNRYPQYTSGPTPDFRLMPLVTPTLELNDDDDDDDDDDGVDFFSTRIALVQDPLLSLHWGKSVLHQEGLVRRPTLARCLNPEGDLLIGPLLVPRRLLYDPYRPDAAGWAADGSYNHERLWIHGFTALLSHHLQQSHRLDHNHLHAATHLLFPHLTIPTRNSGDRDTPTTTPKERTWPGGETTEMPTTTSPATDSDTDSDTAAIDTINSTTTAMTLEIPTEVVNFLFPNQSVADFILHHPFEHEAWTLLFERDLCNPSHPMLPSSETVVLDMIVRTRSV